MVENDSLLPTLYFLAGGFFAYHFFSLLGYPLLFWILRGRPPLECSGLRYATGTICFSTVVYFCELRGLKIAHSALLGIIVPSLLFLLGPWRRFKWRDLAGDDFQPGALWPPLVFAAFTAFLFSKPGMQVFYEVWMYFSVERNVAADLFPAINPGVLGETFEKSHGGFMITGGVAGLLGVDAKDVSVCCKVANVFGFFSLSRAFLSRFKTSRFAANTGGSLMLMVTGMTPLFLWIFLHAGKPSGLKEGWGTKDAFRDIIGAYSSTGGGANSAFFNEIYHLFDNMLGVLIVCAAALIATFYQCRRGAVLCLAVLFWGACLIYSMYGLQMGAIIAAVALMGIIFGKSTLRRRLAVSGPAWLIAGCVAVPGLLLAAGAQTEKTAKATVFVLEGTYLGLKLLPHFSNLLAPMGLLTPILLLAAPLYHWPIGRGATRMYWAVWFATVFIVLFLRTVGGNNYKFAFVIPFLALPMLTRIWEKLGELWRTRWIPYLVVAGTYAALVLTVSLFYSSQFANKTEYPIWSKSSERERYLVSIYPAFAWIRENTPGDAYILIFPFGEAGSKATSTTNFIPSYGTHRRIVYIRDAMYVDPLPASEQILGLVERAYSDQPAEQIAALENLAQKGRIFAVGTAEHPLHHAEKAGRLVFEQNDLHIYELTSPAGTHER